MNAEFSTYLSPGVDKYVVYADKPAKTVINYVETNGICLYNSRAFW